MAATNNRQVLIETGDLLCEPVPGSARAVEVGDSADGDSRPGSGYRPGEVPVLAIRPGEAKLIQQIRTEGRYQLHSDYMCPVREVGRGVQRIKPAYIRVEGKIVLKIVVTEESRVLVVDDP